MNIPISWLKQAANINAPTPEILEKLTSTGNAVEGVTAVGKDITNVVVGRVNSLERHPDADKLWVTQTDIGTEVLQIITGADNLKAGDLVPVALHGSTLANGIKIKKGKMRGLDSNGMLCSIEELGHTIADFPESPADGIFVFASDHPLGADVVPIMELFEEVADFDILSNRPDTNSVVGMARELAAVYGNTLATTEIVVKEASEQDTSDIVTVEIQDPARCPRYIARVVKNVKIAPSPQWLRRRLTSAGVRPINNIVDITNYVMLEYGQPLHAFDISAVAQKDGKHNIIVRTANAGDKFTTLDGEERTLTDSTLLIADHEKSIGIAGIMGGENSKILDNTTTILFESANFDHANIRQTSRALGLRTDASARYEKGQDPNIAITSINRAMELVEMLECGDVQRGCVDAYKTPRHVHEIAFTPCGVRALLSLQGEDISREDMCAYLSRIGITTREEADKIIATIPTHRADMTCEADIAEEVVRFYGLNNIVSRYHQVISTQTATGKSLRRRRADALKSTMLALGYSEALTYPFESPKVFDKLNLPASSPLRDAVTLKNPLGEDFSILRTITLGGLLESLARNYNKGNEGAALFEMSCTYGNLGSDSLAVAGAPPFVEQPFLTLASHGKDADYFVQKGDIETLLSTVTNRPCVFEKLADVPFMHPGRSAQVYVKVSPNPRDAAVLVGYFGELHPQVTKNYEIGTRAYVAVLDMDALHEIAEAYKFKYQSPANYPAISRDLALKVPADIPAADIESAIREKGGQYFYSVQLFDVYQGAQVGDGYKSMAYSIKFRASDKTLAVPDVQGSIDAILANLQKKHNAEIRG